jgi:hypothetical protein
MSDLRARFLESLWKNYEEYIDKRHSMSIHTFVRSNRREFCFMPGLVLSAKNDMSHMCLDVQKRSLLFAPEFFYALSRKHWCHYSVVVSCNDPEVVKMTQGNLHWSWGSIELCFYRDAIKTMEIRFGLSSYTVYLCYFAHPGLPGTEGQPNHHEANDLYTPSIWHAYLVWRNFEGTPVSARQRAWKAQLIDWLVGLHSINFSSYTWMWVFDLIDDGVRVLTPRQRLVAIDSIIKSINARKAARSSKVVRQKR